MKQPHTINITIALPEKCVDILLQEAAARMMNRTGITVTVESLCVEIIGEFLDVVEQNKKNHNDLARG